MIYSSKALLRILQLNNKKRMYKNAPTVQWLKICVFMPLNYERNSPLDVPFSTFGFAKRQLRCPTVLSVRIRRRALVLCENSHNTSFRPFCTVFLHPQLTFSTFSFSIRKSLLFCCNFYNPNIFL